ncbi:MAG: sigma-70 family RNA polymerase sigma factor [Candidatus Poribacteria bacterium]|nr:sigma-70 family RNA polymerase sigma factor [Candidatus Poribacteria bacterium]
MNNNDSHLIKRTLEGDQQAFASLVEKYQDQIHTLAWQKIGDFHIAQEITQDTFINAYQKLATLKHPTRFAGWLYVITNNNCKMWHRKNRLQTQSLDETDPMELAEIYYSEHQTHEREEAANENRRSVVKELLNKLRESERTVVTLHYLAGLSCEEIGEFLGVATNTVKSRLHRARNRLRQEEAMIKENLSSFKLPTNFTENIMEAISKVTPMTSAPNKPMIPWLISATSAVIILIILGTGTYQIYNFQKPYSLDSTSDKTIEITEAKQVIDSDEKSSKRNLVAKANLLNQDNNVSQELNSPLADTENLDETNNINSSNKLQKGSASLSGIVVDTDGKAVQDLDLTIKPMKINENGSMVELTPVSSWKNFITDNKGRFSFIINNPVALQFVLLPDAVSDYVISSLTIGDLTFFNNTIPLKSNGMTFAIEPGMALDNTIVTVKPPPRRIRGRILLRNGKPLAYAGVDLTIHAGEHDTFLYFLPEFAGSIMSTSASTDSQGYFVHYLSNEIDRDYKVKVNYHGSTDTSGWFQLREGKWKDDLVFRVRDLQRVKNKINKRVKAQQRVWTVNPNNGHAYKRIVVDSWEDAKAKAKSEKAYLVAINDEAEQKWLETRFPEYLFYWIGLTSNQDGSFDQWTNGEQLTYVNWMSNEKSNEPNIHIALDFFSKRWMKIDVENQFLPAIQLAIIEKEDIKIKSKK